MPGNVLDRQVDNDLPKDLDAILNDGSTVGFDVAGTEWSPLGGSSGSCWDNANTCGPTGWIKSSFTIASTGTYYLEFGVNNWGDTAFDSALAFDFTGLNPATSSAPTSSVPEPPPVAMMALELGLVAVIVCRAAAKRPQAQEQPLHRQLTAIPSGIQKEGIENGPRFSVSALLRFAPYRPVGVGKMATHDRPKASL